MPTASSPPDEVNPRAGSRSSGDAPARSAARILGPHLLTIHAKDFLSEVGNIRGFTHLFQGDVPWQAVMAALREVAYDGYLVAEVPPYRFAPEEGIRDIGRKLDILLGLG